MRQTAPRLAPGRPTGRCSPSCRQYDEAANNVKVDTAFAVSMPRGERKGPQIQLDDFLNAAVAPSGLVRRPDIELDRAIVSTLVAAIKKSPGHALLLPLDRAVALLRLDSSYSKVGHAATLLASALARKMKAMGFDVMIGAVNKGQILAFRLR